MPSTHVHQFSGWTSFDDGHRHGYSGVTGPSIYSERTHYHRMSATTLNDGHTHSFSITTGPAESVGPSTHIHRYFGVTTPNGRGPHTHRFAGTTSVAPDDVPEM